jgi:hypothetical protein
MPVIRKSVKHLSAPNLPKLVFTYLICPIKLVAYQNLEYRQMTKTESESVEPRKYPDFYEKLVPLAIGTIVIVIVGVLVFAFGVALGLIQGT